MSRSFHRVFFQKRRTWTFTLLATLSILSRAEDVTKVSVTCPAHQKSHGGSCYEVVGLRHTFPGARSWCEQRAGHLAFILDEEMQVFLERQLDPDEDFWFGAASSAAKPSQGSPGDGESFSGKYLQKMMNFDLHFMQV